MLDRLRRAIYAWHLRKASEHWSAETKEAILRLQAADMMNRDAYLALRDGPSIDYGSLRRLGGGTGIP